LIENLRTTLKKAVFITLVIVMFACLNFAARAHDDSPITSKPSNAPTGDIVTLSPAARDAIGLKVMEIQKLPLPREIAAYGTIEAMPTKTYIQHALLGGRILDVKAELGDQVKKGQILAILDSPEINRLAAETLNTKNNIDTEIKKAKADYATERKSAQSRLELAQATYNRLVTLMDEKIAALKSLETAKTELEVAKNRVDNLKRKEEVEINALELKLRISLRSLTDRLRQFGVPKEQIDKMLASDVAVLQVPIAGTRGGVVTDVHANPGETINGEDALFDILDYTIVWAEAEVYEGDMDRVAAGQKVWVKANALPGVKFEGKVSHVGSEVDPKKRTLPVRVEIPNPKLRLKPDMFVELFIQTEEPTLAIKVPKDAVVEGTGHYGVFVEVKPGTYQLTRVTQGRSFGDDVEIAHGLRTGQRIVSRGAFQLDANLLKTQGSTDAFSHPTEQSAHHDHEEEDGNKNNNDKPPVNPMLIVLAVGAFVLGIGVAALFMRSGKRPEKSSDDQ